MVMVMMDFTGCHKTCDCVLVASGMTQYFSAFANTLVRLYVRTG
jgi:hypothetical protein